MEGTIEQVYLHAVQGKTRQHTVRHSLLEALLHGGNILLGDIAALDRVHKLKASNAFVSRPDSDNNVGKFSTSPGLFLEHFAVLVCRRDCFLVGYLRRSLVALHLELPFETIQDNLQMQLTHPANHCLTGISISPDLKGRILLCQLGKRVAKFVQVSLGLGFHSHANHGIREGDGLQNNRMVHTAKRISGTQILESDYRTDIPGTTLFNRVLLVGMHLEQTGNALFFPRTGVEHIGTTIHNP